LKSKEKTKKTAVSTNITITYRTATPTDATAIARLHARSWQENYRGSWKDEFLDHEVIPNRLEVWKKRFERPNEQQYVLLAEDQGNLCGFACTFLDYDPHWGAFMDNLHVSSSHQRKGIGQTLMRKSIERIIQHDPASKLYLWVLQANESAIRFYEKNGGKRVEETLYNNPDGGQSPIFRYVWDDLNKTLIK
jgi:ribosomal protein S18 acetylase RimI-like enzyme